jgi:hypothetical protein
MTAAIGVRARNSSRKLAGKLAKVSYHRFVAGIVSGQSFD